LLDIFHTVLVGISIWSYLIINFGDRNIHDRIFWLVEYTKCATTELMLVTAPRSLGVTVAVTVSCFVSFLERRFTEISVGRPDFLCPLVSAWPLRKGAE
jgi:hypothetical protein